MSIGFNHLLIYNIDNMAKAKQHSEMHLFYASLVLAIITLIVGWITSLAPQTSQVADDSTQGSSVNNAEIREKVISVLQSSAPSKVSSSTKAAIIDRLR